MLSKEKIIKLFRREDHQAVQKRRSSSCSEEKIIKLFSEEKIIKMLTERRFIKLLSKEENIKLSVRRRTSSCSARRRTSSYSARRRSSSCSECSVLLKTVRGICLSWSRACLFQGNNPVLVKHCHPWELFSGFP